MTRRIFSLSQVNKSIQQTLEARYRSEFWVQAEMNKLNHYPHSGHCFPELVEKKDGRIIAQMKATLWKMDFERINRNFQTILKEPLKDGIKILMLARISFDPTHGLSLKILDIDPAYTLGDLEKEKQETLERLQKENIFNLNKAIDLPLLPQRIAIISVESSKGYADFLKVLDGNHWNYKFFHLLFPSLLQGEKAVPGIISQLEKIRKVKHHFDVVAIIRGGGGDIGLSCYNDYRLAKAIAKFPLPILTGIGHATNETIAEMIAHTNAITPTKIAEFLIQRFHNFAEPVKNAERVVSEMAIRSLRNENTSFQHLIRSFRLAAKSLLQEKKHDLNTQASSISAEAKFLISSMTRGIRDVSKTLEKEVHSHLETSRTGLRQLMVSTQRNSAIRIDQEKKMLGYVVSQLASRTPLLLKQKVTILSGIEKNVFNLSPENVLRRGYSITLKNGKAVTNISDLNEGDKIETQVYSGTFNSTVISTKKDQ